MEPGVGMKPRLQLAHGQRAGGVQLDRVALSRVAVVQAAERVGEARPNRVAHLWRHHREARGLELRRNQRGELAALRVHAPELARRQHGIQRDRLNGAVDAVLGNEKRVVLRMPRASGPQAGENRAQDTGGSDRHQKTLLPYTDSRGSESRRSSGRDGAVQSPRAGAALPPRPTARQRDNSGRRPSDGAPKRPNGSPSTLTRASTGRRITRPSGTPPR